MVGQMCPTQVIMQYLVLLTVDGNIELTKELTTQKFSEKGIVAKKHLLVIISDSPKVMIKLRRMFIQDFPRCISLDCVLHGLHALNLVTKDIVKTKSIEISVKRYRMLVNYLRKSSFWNEYMDNWATENILIARRDSFQ